MVPVKIDRPDLFLGSKNWILENGVWKKDLSQEVEDGTVCMFSMSIFPLKEKWRFSASYKRSGEFFNFIPEFYSSEDREFHIGFFNLLSSVHRVAKNFSFDFPMEEFNPEDVEKCERKKKRRYSDL